jgi:hypothetical protein
MEEGREGGREEGEERVVSQGHHCRIPVYGHRVRGGAVHTQWEYD